MAYFGPDMGSKMAKFHYFLAQNRPKLKNLEKFEFRRGQAPNYRPLHIFCDTKQFRRDIDVAAAAETNFNILVIFGSKYPKMAYFSHFWIPRQRVL